MDKGIIYLDHAATTYVKPSFEAMKPWFTEYYGNPSAIYSLGRQSKRPLRKPGANSLLPWCSPNRNFFTGSGTEADNWAIKGTALANQKRGKHVITTVIEHHAVLEAFDFLSKEDGF